MGVPSSNNYTTVTHLNLLCTNLTGLFREGHKNRLVVSHKAFSMFSVEKVKVNSR